MRPFALALATAAALAAPVAEAATLGVFTHDYGSNPGRIDPGGNDVLGATFVTVSDQSTSRFFDSFDFSSLVYSSIDSLTLTLTFDRAGPSLFPAEVWAVRIQGSNSAALLDDYFVPLADILSPQSITINLATDLLFVDAFAHSLATEGLTFWFSEFTLFPDAFRLRSATLTVSGVVPLPAGGFLLIGALGGLVLLRRRKTA